MVNYWFIVNMEGRGRQPFWFHFWCKNTAWTWKTLLFILDREGWRRSLMLGLWDSCSFLELCWANIGRLKSCHLLNVLKKLGIWTFRYNGLKISYLIQDFEYINHMYWTDKRNTNFLCFTNSYEAIYKNTRNFKSFN